MGLVHSGDVVTVSSG